MKIETFKEWMQVQFSQIELTDIVNYGVANGFAGLVYYRETTVLYKKYKYEIWEILQEESESLGVSLLEMLAETRLGKNAVNADQFENFLVWFVAEKIARDLTAEE